MKTNVKSAPNITFRLSWHLLGQLKALADRKMGCTPSEELVRIVVFWMALCSRNTKAVAQAFQVARQWSDSSWWDAASVELLDGCAEPRLSFRLPLELKRAFKQFADERDHTVTEEMVSALMLWVSLHEGSLKAAIWAAQIAGLRYCPEAVIQTYIGIRAGSKPAIAAGDSCSQKENPKINEAHLRPSTPHRSQKEVEIKVAAPPLSVSDFNRAYIQKLGVGHASMEPDGSASPSGCSTSWRPYWKRRRPRQRPPIPAEALEVFEHGPEALGYLGQHREKCANLSQPEQIAVSVLARGFVLQEVRSWIRRIKHVSTALWENLLIAVQERPELETWERALDYWAAHTSTDVPNSVWHINSIWRLLATPDSDPTGPRFIARYAARKYHDLCSGSPRNVRDIVDALKESPQTSSDRPLPDSTHPNHTSRVLRRTHSAPKRKPQTRKGLKGPSNLPPRNQEDMGPSSQSSWSNTKPPPALRNPPRSMRRVPFSSTPHSRQANPKTCAQVMPQRGPKPIGAPPPPDFVRQSVQRLRARAALVDRDPEALRRSIRMFEQSAELARSKESRAEILVHVEARKRVLAELLRELEAKKLET